MSDHLHTYIEPELEARITALVLGEVSEFDVEELERVIGEQPELQIFRRRMEAMHELLGEAVKPEKDEAWQLSEDRRAELRHKFSQTSAPVTKPSTVVSVAQWRSIVGIAACLVVCFVIFSTMTPHVYKSAERSQMTPEIISYMAPMEEADEKLDSDNDIVWASEAGEEAFDSLSRKRPSKNSGKGYEKNHRDKYIFEAEGEKKAIGSEDSKLYGGGKFKSKLSSAKKDHEVPLLADIPMTGELFKNESKAANGRVTKRSMSRSVERKPSAPSSSMAKVIAANTMSNTAIPVPEVGVPDLSVDFGDGDDFGDGWADGGGGRTVPLSIEGRLGSIDDKEGKDRIIRRELTMKPGEAGFAYVPSEEKDQKEKGLFHSSGDGEKYDGKAVTLRIDGSVVTRGEPLANSIRGGLDQSIVGYAGSADKKDGDIAFFMADESFKSNADPFAGESLGINASAEGIVNQPARSKEDKKALAELQKAPGIQSLTGVYSDGSVQALQRQKYEKGRKTAIVSSGKRSEVEIIREFKYPSEYEPPELPNSVAKAKPGKKNAFPVTPATPSSFETRNTGVTLESEASDANGKYEGGIGGSTIVQKEIARRKSTVTEADRALMLGRDAYAKGEYEEASKQYKLADGLLPPGPALDDRERSYKGHQGDANVALAQKYRRVGKYEEARKALEETLHADPTNFAAEKQLAYLDDHIRTDPALSSRHIKNVDKVRKNLYMGEGYYNLGKYDKAEAEMKKVLQTDPYNKAARRWLEKVASTKSDYYRAAYDHTRAELLAEVDKAWEITVPSEVENLENMELSKEKRLKPGQDELQKVKGVKSKADPKPTQKPIKSPQRPKPLPEETSTSAQPFSTFSLNVADVSFKLAKVALLEKGQWPDAAKVRTEEFVNAFDYGDPSPRRGEPVACAIEQAAHPFLQQRNLVRIGMKTAALGRSTPLRLTVLLDNSGSMEREDREASVLAAIQVLASQLGPQDKITLVGFARQPRLLADRVSGDQAGKLVDIVANTPSEGGTNIEEALRLARKLAKRQHTEGAQDRVVLITDGVANLGNTVPEELSREIEIMRQEGIAFDACGVGAEDLNDEILEALTRKGDGRYYFLNRPEDADSGFAKQLAGALSPAAKNVKVQVVFNPDRVDKYRLLGFEKHRLNKEDFRNDQVDAAEMAAEEAGNAVYQVQVKPDGVGDLGEVFVRFMDANTGRMVERSWPISYQPQTKSFDLAEPSMQLASAAAMLGEKLHGTDAGSVRFSNISKTLGKLRAHYAANRKVQDLIRMCEKVQ